MSDLRKDDGGPAFPKPLDPYPNMQDARSGTEGMSLRDYFAAQALALMMREGTEALAAQMDEPDLDGLFERTARFSYRMADAMIKARSA